MTTELPPPLRLPASDKFETFFSWPSFRQSFLLLHADMGKEEEGGGDSFLPSCDDNGLRSPPPPSLVA